MVQPSNILLTYVGLMLLAILNLQAIESIHCTKYYGRQSAFQFREKPRATRGFKSVALSTARGFGKRDPMFRMPLSDQSFLPKVTPKDSFPIDWIIEEMQNNPELMRTLLKKFIDINHDDEISAEELMRPGIIKPMNNLNLEEEQ